MYCELWLEFGSRLFNNSYPYEFNINVPEESFDAFINNLSLRFAIEIEEVHDKDFDLWIKRYFAFDKSKPDLKVYIGFKSIKWKGGKN